MFASEVIMGGEDRMDEEEEVPVIPELETGGLVNPIPMVKWDLEVRLGLEELDTCPCGDLNRD